MRRREWEKWVPVVELADGRAALEEGRGVGNGGGLEVQVVVGGLGRDGQRLGLGLGEQREG